MFFVFSSEEIIFSMVQTQGGKKEEIRSNMFKKRGLKYIFIYAINITTSLLFVKHCAEHEEYKGG